MTSVSFQYLKKQQQLQDRLHFVSSCSFSSCCPGCQCLCLSFCPVLPSSTCIFLSFDREHEENLVHESYLEIPYFFFDLSIKILETMQILLYRKDRDTFMEIEQQLLLHQNPEKEYMKTRSVTLCLVSKAPSRNFKTDIILSTESKRDRTKGREERRLDSYRLELLLHFHCIPCSLSHHRVLSSFRVSFLFFRVTNVSHPSFDGLSDPFCLSSHSSFFLLMRPLVLFYLCNQYLFFRKLRPILNNRRNFVSSKIIIELTRGSVHCSFF